jgi:hypothetical protein
MLQGKLDIMFMQNDKMIDVSTGESTAGLRLERFSNWLTKDSQGNLAESNYVTELERICRDGGKATCVGNTRLA